MATSDIKMNGFTPASNAAYIYAEAADGSQIKIKKSDLLNEMFLYRGSLSHYNDTSLKNGFYADFNNAMDRPSKLYEYGMLLVIAIGTSMILHVHVSTRSTITIRTYSSNMWGEWKSISFT